jgi:hypothetical protein
VRGSVGYLESKETMFLSSRRVRHPHHCRRFLPVCGLSFLYCTMHPSGSRFSIFIALVKMSRGSESQRIYDPSSLLVFTSHPCPLCGPRKSSVPGRVQKESTFMVGYQHYVAHGVVSKDEELGSISGVERLTNQRSWLFQQKNGFPVPAQLDYRNIFSSSNSTGSLMM